MAKVERIEPTQLPNGLWLNGNEYASENVEESSGVLSLVTGETDGYRVGPELDLSAISDVGRSKLEWTSSGDVEVLAAVSEVSAQGCGDLDGIDDYYAVGTGSQFALSSFSIFVRFRCTKKGVNGLHTIVSRQKDTSASGRNYTLWLSEGSPFSAPANSAWLDVGDTDGSILSLFASDKDYLDGAWHTLLAIVDDSVKTGYLYADGALRHTDSYTGSPYTGDSPTTIGRQASGVERFFLGNIYNCIIYSDVLSLPDYQALINGNIADGNRQGHWPLDDSPGSTTARDLSGNNNNGTIIGASYSPDNPLLQQATNGQAIPGISVNDDLTGKKLYTQQRFNRDTTGDPSPTLTSLTAEVNGTGGAFSLINGGLIRSAHTQNNTMIR